MWPQVRKSKSARLAPSRLFGNEQTCSGLMKPETLDRISHRRPRRSPNARPFPTVMDCESAKESFAEEHVKAPFKTAVKGLLHAARKGDDMAGQDPGKS